MSRGLLFLAAASVLSAQMAGGDVIPGQLNDFEDGTLQSWLGGVTLTNIATGGPAGAGDHYLEVSQPLSFRKLGAFNSASDWTGDYQAVGVAAITADFRTTHATPLDIRLVLFGPGGSITSVDRWTSTAAEPLANDGAWHTLTFSILGADLTQVRGTDPYTDTITGVQRILLRHQSGLPAVGGTSIAADMDIDNITAIAVPEPSAIWGGLSLLAVIGLRRGSRRSNG